ncbi:MAG: sugar phosphate isomerase/epimerase family protein [Planctomycetia bacterium]|nr:sugar phosphate isomerase/epimerase family protein [Planctomycetia bacterium]
MSEKIKFAYSSNAYRLFSVEECIQRIASLGYTGMELLADVPHAYPVSLLPEQKTKILKCLEENHLEISNINAFMMNAVADTRQTYIYPSWIEPYAPYRALRREHTKRVLNLASELRAPSIQTEPGGPLPEGMSRKEALAIFYEEFMPCVEVAEKCGVDLLIEPEPALLIEKCEQFLEFIEKIDSSRVGLNFDLGHAFCVEDDILYWIPQLAKYIRHYHIEDISATRVHHHLIPGEGVIDFPPILKTISSTGYSGFITVELYPFQENPDDAGRKALEFFRNLCW